MILSRKWERQITRNQKQVRKLQKNKSTSPAWFQKKEKRVMYKGRNVILPAILLVLSFFFMFVLSVIGDRDFMFWLAIISYWLLALFFFLKRPYLAIGTTELATYKWSREVCLKPSEVQAIWLEDDSTVIVVKQTKQRWVFSRIPHFYPIKEMNSALYSYATKHSIDLVDKRSERK